MRRFILIGYTGQLGGALSDALRSRGDTVVNVNTKSVKLLTDDATRLPPAAIECLQANHPTDVICAAGEVDPNAPESRLFEANVELPLAIYRAIRSTRGTHRFFTFGSVHESVVELGADNRYLNSKRRLLEERKAEMSREEGPQWNHIQLHTLYGGLRSHSHMFLGQIEEALRTSNDFEMSSGDQLREYHHVEDVAKNVLSILERTGYENTLDLSSGEPLSLKEIATSIFQHFGAEKQLHLGTLPDPAGEIYTPQFKRSPSLFVYRPAIPNILRWLESRMESR